MTRTSWLVASALAVAACGGQTQSAQDAEDMRGVEEIGSPNALTALVGVATFNSTTGAMIVPLGSSDKLLIVSRRGVDNAILLNGRIVMDPAGVIAVASGSTGLLKTLQISVGADATTVVLDYLNGYFAPGVTGTLTAAAPIIQGATVDFGAHTGCAFKIRATGAADTVYFGKDKTTAANKVVSFNNGNFPDVWVKTSGSPIAPLTWGISLGDGNDVFSASPGAALGGLLSSFTDPITIHGGLGNDTITGGKGADIIYGDEGDNLVDESAYNDSIVVTAATARTLTFASAKTITASSGSFISDGFTAGSSVVVTGTTLNGTALAPKTFTVATGGVAATVLTVVEAMATETAFSSAATLTQLSTIHAKDTVYGLAPSAPGAGVTTVTYAARPNARGSAGVVVKIGHDTAATPAFLAGTEDNLDETVAVVIGTDFPDTMWCSDTTDAPCTLVGGKGDDTLKAGKSAINTHKLYGGDGADTLVVTDNTDKALLVGGNWTDAARPAVVVTASGSRTLTFNVAKTITASSGSFITDGFTVGASIVVAGTTGNGTLAVPKTYTVAVVTATVITTVEAIVTEAAYSATATVTLPALVAPRNQSIDTVDYSALTAAAVTIDMTFGLPTVPKAYTPAVAYSGASAKKHTNITKDITRARCPQASGAQVCTFVGNNSGNYVIAGKGADVLTGGTGDDTFDLSAVDNAILSPNLKVVTGGGGTDSVDFSGRSVDTAIDLSCTTSACRSSGSKQFDPGIAVTASTNRSIAFDATAGTITSAGTAAGSFITEGFAVGQTITISGTTSNDADVTITAVTATVITVSETLVDEPAVTSAATITRAPADQGIVITAAAGRTLTFNVAKTITASSGSFISDGFKAGQTITVAGTVANGTALAPATFTIASLTATALTVVEAVVTEAAYTSGATITRAPVAKLVEGISLIGITNATCPASAGVLACTMTGNSDSNTMDFNGCIGSVSCGGGADLILNAGAGVDTHCGL